MDWTEEKIAELTRLWGGKLSTSAIGEKLGCSKNVVVGKAHRLGLPPLPSPIQRREPEQLVKMTAEAIRLKGEGLTDREIGERLGIGMDTASRMLRAAGHGGRGGRRRALPVGAGVPRLVSAAPRAVVAPAEPSVPVAAHPLVRLGGGCRWPIGEPRTPGFRFCEKADVVAGKPYCAEHCARAYTVAHSVPGQFLLRRLGTAA
jgi:GcrA cell cycle regulator